MSTTRTLQIQSNIRNYPVYFPEAPDFLLHLDARPHHCYVIDSNVWRLYSESCLRGLDRDRTIVLPADEERKNLDTVQALYDSLIRFSAKRNLTLISIGGGIVQDVTGFAASTMYRGINWVFVPTTLLAQADSCIGAKTSLNYKNYKNLIGTFYPPSEVYIYTPFLVTQAREYFFSGLGEVARLHLIGGADKVQRFLRLLPKAVDKDPSALLESVFDSLVIKQNYITGDEFDTGRRNLLNYGHCFGHALESVSAFEIPHGQAVVLGMLLANIVARRRGILSEQLQRFISDQVLRPILVVYPQADHLRPEGMLDAMRKDKKQTGDGFVLIMLKNDYEIVKVSDLNTDEVIAALDELGNLLNI